MRVIKKAAVVPYSAAQMYDLVNDIEAYPEYLPWCRGSKILESSETEIAASIQLSRGGIHHTFSTINCLVPKKAIELKLLDGPFRHLKGLWRFEDLRDNGCRVSFDLEFEFSNKILDMAAGSFLEKVANTFLEAFSLRAKDVYKRVYKDEDAYDD